MRGPGDYHIDGPVPETPEPAVYPAPWTATRVVGTRRPRVDAYERVSGTAVYPSDVILPDMLYGAILRCPHAHARVLGVDTSAAAGMPGVAAVISAADREADLDWHYSGGDSSKLFDPLIRFEGDTVAAVAAETPQQARDAARAIAVRYEVLPHVLEPERALAQGAPLVGGDGNRQGEADTHERGDIAAGFAEADVVLEKTFRTEYELHNPMELHGCVARWDGGRLVIWESLQGVYITQTVISRVLGLPLASVRVIGHYMGGGFGSKLQPSKHTVIAALLARRTARPVKLFLSREEVMLVAGNRPGTVMRLKAGVKRDGTLTALDFSSLSSAGGHFGGGAGIVDWVVKDLYTCPNVRTRNELAFINAGPARPMRAPGHPQGAWALEQMMDALADAIGMDPVELRLRNVPAVSQARGNQPYTSTGLRECLEEGAKAFGWDEARKAPRGDDHLRRGVGVAACLWVAGGGGPPSTAIVKMYSDGSVNLNLGASDIGTGTKTVMAMVVAEELGIDPDAIQIENADTGTTQFATSSGGSKTVPTESPAVREAAYLVKKQLLEAAAEDKGWPLDDLVLVEGAVARRSNLSERVPIRELSLLQRRGVVVGVGYRGPNPEGKIVNPFAAQFCEVEVNTRTGEVTVLRFVAAHESGRVLNRLTFDNQVFGGIAMGIGFAMTEERVLDEATGKMVSMSLHDYKIPTALDVPADMSVVAVDPHDHECNTTSTKGVGEPATIPTAPAVANAVHHATGVWMTHAPTNAVRLIELLEAERKGA
ncbi:MAG: xanthine dehydrogenase family protein molybdopterin-binding subunit [Holophagae bacterium]|nr:MAG: xanthine dehydrogenase family protein molybdopterin-binding subunit [Holophagae bacterium]